MLNVKQKYLNELKDIFNKYCPNAEIWAYGSRITNDCHSGSDLDLVVKNFNDPSKHLFELNKLLCDSNIPFLIDIKEFDNLPPSFQEEIKRNYIKIEFSNTI